MWGSKNEKEYSDDRGRENERARKGRGAGGEKSDGGPSPPLLCFSPHPSPSAFRRFAAETLRRCRPLETQGEDKSEETKRRLNNDKSLAGICSARSIFFLFSSQSASSHRRRGLRRCVLSLLQSAQLFTVLAHFQRHDWERTKERTEGAQNKRRLGKESSRSRCEWKKKVR